MSTTLKALRIYLGLLKAKYGNISRYSAEFSKKRSFYSEFLGSSTSLFLDVGANVGNRTEVFVALTKNVVAVEPQPICAQVLRMRFGSKIIQLELGLDSSNCEKPIYVSSSHTLSSFSNEWITKARSNRFSQATWKEGKVVSMRTLDSIIDQFGIPAFVKIDVEGFEKNILTSITRPFKYLSFEVNHPENIENTLEILDYLDVTYQTVRFKFSYGESLVFERNEWLNRRDFIQQERKLFGENPIWGDIYVMNEGN